MMQTPVIVVNDKPIEFGEGIYFGLPDEYYHLIPAISSTMLKNINVSAPDCYVNTPWLNPNYEEDAEDEDSAEWKKFGRATHSRILEGKRIFDQRYCVEFLPPEGCLKTTEQLVNYLVENKVIVEKKPDPDAVTRSSGKAKLVEAVKKHDATAIETQGLKTIDQLIDYLVKASIIVEKKPDPDAVTKSSPKGDLIKAVLRHNPNAMIYDTEEQKYFRETQGRIQLSARDLRRIEIAAAMIEFHPEIKHWLPGSCAEVTVIWKEIVKHPRTGKEITLWFKARFDSLQPGVITDLKTFMNMRTKPIDSSIYAAMASLKYHVQVYHYLRGAYRAARFAKEGVYATFSNLSAPPSGFIEQLGKVEHFDFRFLFQKKGGAPVVRGKRFSTELEMFKVGEIASQQAIELFILYFEAFGKGYWIDNTPVDDFHDGQFPAYAAET